MTQEDLAKEIGVQRSVISKYESGVINPTVAQLQKIAVALSVPVIDLMGLSPEEQSEIQYVEDYVVEKTGQNREDVRNDLLANKLAAAPFDAYMEAMDATDAATVEAFRSVSDQKLKEYLLDSYQHLNRRGRIEAVSRISELEEFPRFKKKPPQPE